MYIQKNPRVRKIFCLQFWGRKWLHQFMGAWKNAFFLQEKKPMSIKFLLLGGGVWGGGECRFNFIGREDFSDKWLIACGPQTPEARGDEILEFQQQDME